MILSAAHHVVVHSGFLAWLGHWWERISGANNESGPVYGSWSGLLGSSFSPGWTQIAAVSIAYGLLRKHNCHVKGCWRIGRHPTADPQYVTCRKHHPEGGHHTTLAAIHAAHRAAKAS